MDSFPQERFESEYIRADWGFGEHERAVHVRRDRLVSQMLQDRRSPRVLSAPHGFGKTALAQEYATRLFAPGDVRWVQASCPGFLEALDRRSLRTALVGQDCVLVVFDDLPYLDEERQREFLRTIEAVMKAGMEVLVTTVPTHDFLRGSLTERTVIKARDLLVVENECVSAVPVGDAESRAVSLSRWKRACERFAGRVAGEFWGQVSEFGDVGFSALFSEGLPFASMKAVLAMLLLGTGNMRDLETLGCTLKQDDERLLIEDYPVLGIDSAKRTFNAGTCVLGELREALENRGLLDSLVLQSRSLPYLVVGMLLKRGDAERIRGVLEAFCTVEQCASWLEENAWTLLDSGEYELVDFILNCCGTQLVDGSLNLVAIESWSNGLQGARREAKHCARTVLRQARGNTAGAENTAEAALYAYLALVAFDPDGSFGNGREAFRDRELMSAPARFLADALDALDLVEVKRALCADDDEQLEQLEQERKPPTQKRVKRLSALFSAASWQLSSYPQFRLAVHMLDAVDDASVRMLAQDLGEDALSIAEKESRNSATGALLARDLWAGGRFGVGARPADLRDARLLENAARVLDRLTQRAGIGEAHVPWDVVRSVHNVDLCEPAGVLVPEGAEDVPVVRVRLFGGFDVVVGSQCVVNGEWRRKSRLLFALLVLQQGRDVSRDEIVDQLWPGVDRARALDSFYNVWSNLNAMLGKGPYLDRSGDFVRVNMRYVISDVGEFEQLFRTILSESRDPQTLLDTYVRIESLYRGGLMSAEADVELIQRQRERYRAMYIDSMVAATDKALKQKDVRLALWFARKGMEFGRDREDVYRALMEAQIAAGQRCSAIRTYFRCKAYLRDELGLDPSLEIQDLYDHLIVTDPSLLRLDQESFALDSSPVGDKGPLPVR